MAPAMAPDSADLGVDEWANLDLREAGRFKDNSRRAAQEAAWSKTNIDARQIWGVREAQRIYGPRLRQAILDLLGVRTLVAGLHQPASSMGRWALCPSLLARILDWQVVGQGACLEFVDGWRRAAKPRSGPLQTLRICLRVRPLLDREVKSGEWTAVESLCRDAGVVCHDGRLSRSGRRLSMNHQHFTLDKVFGPTSKTEEVYAEVVQPLVEAAKGGAAATLLCLGQTGTGKTFTIRGVLDMLVQDLAGSQDGVNVEFFEIHGKKCCDLLAERKMVHLRCDAEGRTILRGQRVVTVDSPEELAPILIEALNLRSSEATERNDASSRSHAICVLSLGRGGVLRLVDLAGSERNFETTKMTAQQHRESAEINYGLMVLKDCFRGHAALQRGEDVFLPFRRSNLTRVLSECFVDPEHQTAVIATASPAAADVIHTVNTLRHATMLAKPLEDLASECVMEIPLNIAGSGSFRDVKVSDWGPEEVREWLQEAEDGRFAHVVVPPKLTGAMLLSVSAQHLSTLFGGDEREARGVAEGGAWTVEAEDTGAELGRAIFAAARRTAIAQGELASRQTQH